MDNSKQPSSVYPYLLAIVIIIFGLYILNNKTNLLSNFFSTAVTKNAVVVTNPLSNPATPPVVAPPPAESLTCQYPFGCGPLPAQFSYTRLYSFSPVVIDNMQFTIESKTNLGKTYNYKTTQGSYIKIMLTGKNIGTSPAYLGNLVLFMMDSNDRKFQPIMNFDFGNNARTYLGGEFSNSELQPGFTGKYYSVFEVSPESTELSLMIGDGRDQNYRIQLQ